MSPPTHHFNPAPLCKQLSFNSASGFLQTRTSGVPITILVCTISVPCSPEAPKQWQYLQSCDRLVPHLEDSIAYIPPMSDLQKEDPRTIQVFLAVSLIRWGNLNCRITVLNSAFCKTEKVLKRKTDILPFPKTDSTKAKDFYLRALMWHLSLWYWAQEQRTESLYHPIKGRGKPTHFQRSYRIGCFVSSCP